ncbi:TPA: hypothetical protein NQG57_001007 [Salmonella enterica subsp. enterica serovar Infantis]|nr:hypothetical protein [Salmonella enterica subsp. enterica serovar Infantis]HCJ0429073.1 hypothetical protein [Salmonella enterica subsp. enterica serovar Infantis]
MSRRLYSVILLATLSACALPASAAWKVTLWRKGYSYPLCDSEDSLDMIEGAISKNDTDMRNQLLESNHCVLVTDKLDAEVLEQSILHGRDKVMLLGKKWVDAPPLFTPIEAVHKPGLEGTVAPELLDSNHIVTPAPATKDDGHSPIEWPPVGPKTQSGFYPINSGPFVYAKDHPELIKKGMSLFMNPIHTADRGKEAVFTGVISGFKKTTAMSMGGDTITHQKCDAFQINDDNTSWQCVNDLKNGDLFFFRTDDPKLTGRKVIKDKDADVSSDEYVPLTAKGDN